MDTSVEYDVIVIGSGFGGSVAALRLSEKGYKVAVLEQGKRFAAGDFPKSNWNLRKFLWAPGLGCRGIFRMTLLSDVFVLSGAGVGGGSLVYANTLYVPPDAFFASESWPKGKDWKESLLPHYRMAQYMLGVTQNVAEGPGDRLLREAAEAMGKGDSYVRTPVGVFFGRGDEKGGDPYFGGAGPERTACNFCGGCMVGCRFGAKNTLDKNYLFFAEKLGCSIFAERQVTDIRALEGGGYAVTHRKTGAWFGKDQKVWRADKVVLSAGVLGTVKLLHECKERGSLPKISEVVGQKVRTNSEAILGVTTPTPGVDHSQGIAITSSIHVDEHTHIEMVRYSKGSDALSGIATLLTDGGPGVSRPWEWLKTVVRHPWRFLRSLWPLGWARKTMILLVMQTLDNSIKLKLRRSWMSLGRRRLDTVNDAENPIPTYIPKGNQVARMIADKTGGSAFSSIPEVFLDIPTTAHILGGAVMGATPQEGVIDAKNEVFGHPGLYVCDGSMIPANLGVNPSLTITAMAEYAISQIPVKEGAEPQAAIDPAWTASRLAEIQARWDAEKNPNLHPLQRPLVSFLEEGEAQK